MIKMGTTFVQLLQRLRNINNIQKKEHYETKF